MRFADDTAEWLMYTDSAIRIDMKSRRLSAIRQLVEHEPVHSQEELRQRLATMGFVVTQATLSRDIKELGLVKRAVRRRLSRRPAARSRLVRGGRVALSRALGEFLLSVDVAQQLVVVKTGPGQAQLLGLAVDRARLPTCRDHRRRRHDSRGLPRRARRAGRRAIRSNTSRQRPERTGFTDTEG